MTKEEFLNKMDQSKLRVIHKNSFTCNIIDSVFTDETLKMYKFLFNSNTNGTYNYIKISFGRIKNVEHLKMTRLTALELFETISLEEQLYLKY
jgi:hypothetical protein